jgi:hypothetical protein
LTLNKEIIHNDIEKMTQLEHTASFIRRKLELAIRESEHKGDLFDFKYDTGKFNQWHIENFPRFEEQKGTKRIFGYYWIFSYGTQEEKLRLYEKEREIRESISKSFEEELLPYELELNELTSKYEKYFGGILYNAPEDGGSSMTEFLTVAVRIMEDS